MRADRRRSPRTSARPPPKSPPATPPKIWINMLIFSHRQIHFDLTITAKSFSRSNVLMLVALKSRNVLAATIALFTNHIRWEQIFNRSTRHHQHISRKPTRIIRMLISPTAPERRLLPVVLRSSRPLGTLGAASSKTLSAGTCAKEASLTRRLTEGSRL